MQITQNRAIHFADARGIQRCGTVREFHKFDDGSMLISVNVRGTGFLITDEDVIIKPSPRVVV